MACGQRASSPRQAGIGAAAIASAAGSRPDTEAVEDDEHDGSRPVRARHPAVVAASRASAVTAARATIPAISSGLSEAPPTSAPSIEGSARNSAMFAAVTLPP